MSYFKMLGFYLFEVVGSIINFAASLFGSYPCLDFGVRFLVFVERNRITDEQKERTVYRQEKEDEASALHQKAKDNG